LREFLQMENRVAIDRLVTFEPYPKQLAWLNASLDHQESMVRGANRSGKTTMAAVAAAMHLTGEYDAPWYQGHRFEKPVTVWCAGRTAEAARDVIQAQLLGGLGEKFGTGWIPKRCLVGAPTLRQAGVRNCVDMLQVRHASGGLSTCVIKSFEMGSEKFAGSAVDLIWIDEEPSDYGLYTSA